MMVRAIKTRQMDFLKMIWATNKNFEYTEKGEESEEEATSSEEVSVELDTKTIFMYDDLIK